jgi:hypothetical protein
MLLVLIVQALDQRRQAEVESAEHRRLVAAIRGTPAEAA